MRGADAGPFPQLMALPALWAGLLYDRAALDGAVSLIDGWTEEERQTLRDQVPRLGLATPFRGQKGRVYEGGLRVPGLIEWPERIPHPRVSDVNAVTSDTLPTICELVGLPLPDRPLDGISLKALIDGGVELAGNLVLAAVADEEYSSLGTASVIDRCKVDGAIVTEPTQLQVCLAHKGYTWMRVTTRGRAAHGSRFEEGVDANMHMGRVLRELDRLERDLRSGSRHPLVGPPSLHAALLKGGSGLSTYAATSELQIERRTIPGETPEQVEREVQNILDRLHDEDDEFTATVETFFSRDPFEVDPGAAIVGSVEKAVWTVLDRAPVRVGDTPWMDAALLAAAGVETVVIGPVGAGAHAPEEWVDLESVVQLAGILAEAAMDYCG
ncbi:MAG: M20/M25/M40 family metallo-hydrolase [Gemmatimonadetes bacterium]|nr:M20/M25/M40 family metallo-hydrolase [Gemmatimonadota bacterium]